MKNVNTSTKKLASFSDEYDDESTTEFHIVGTIEPGEDDRHPRYRITDVTVSPIDEEDDEDEEPVVRRIQTLRRQENGNIERSVVKRRRADDDDGEFADSAGYDEHPELDDTEDLRDDDGDETIMSCIQKSIRRR